MMVDELNSKISDRFSKYTIEKEESYLTFTQKLTELSSSTPHKIRLNLFHLRNHRGANEIRHFFALQSQ